MTYAVSHIAVEWNIGTEGDRIPNLRLLQDVAGRLHNAHHFR